MFGSIILIIIFTFLNAVFASAEIAVISMKEARLKHLADNGDKRAQKLSALTEQPARFLATIQVAITVSGFLNSAFASDNFAGMIVDALLSAGVPIPENVLHSVSVLFVTILLAYISIVLGELVPKRIAMKNPEALSLGLAPALSGIARIFSPIVTLLTFSANLLLRLFGINPADEGEQITKEEIQMMLTEGNEQGILNKEENEFIQNVFDFNDTTAEQICTHRSEVVALNAEDTPQSWKTIINSHRHSFYPVYRENREHIVGILDTKDYFRLEEKSMERIFREAVNPAFFVPESMKAAKLFREMKRTRNYFSVVLNEYGEMTGVVTLHDLVEELVGEIYEEDEPVTEKIKLLSPNVWRILGDADMDDVKKELHLNLPDDQYDTFNGFLYHILDKIPEDESRFSCEGYGMHIEVESVKNHVIVEATVSLLPPADTQKE